jgi:aminopeptidase C
VATDAKTKSEVLGAIAEHYGISPQEAYAEVVSDGAEHLLDYLTEPIRSAVNVLFQRHRIAA